MAGCPAVAIHALLGGVAADPPVPPGKTRMNPAIKPRGRENETLHAEAVLRVQNPFTPSMQAPGSGIGLSLNPACCPLRKRPD